MDSVPHVSCPCLDRHAAKVCATCGHSNLAGHARPQHRGFLRVVDPTGGADMCTICAISTVAVAADVHDVTLLLGVPAAEVALT